MKKILVIILCITLISSLVSCNKKEVVSTPDAKKDSIEGEKEIVILMPYNHNDRNKDYLQYILMIKTKFQNENDVKVKIETIDINTYEDIIKKRNVKLYTEDGPTLIMLDTFDSSANYIEQGIALEIKDNLNNEYFRY